MEDVSAINSLAKSKRKSPVDTLLVVGTVLIIAPSFGFYLLQDSWLVAFPILMMAVGICVIIYALRLHWYLCKNAPEMLMPTETQVQTRILRMLLSDDMSQQDKVEIIKQMSGPPSGKHPTIGG